MFSSLSLADVSNISVFSLPIYAIDIKNSSWYTFGAVDAGLNMGSSRYNPPTNVISLPTLPPRWVRRPLDPQTLQDMEPESEKLLNGNERIDDLADDLDARALREHDQRMWQKKRMKTAEKYPYAIDMGSSGYNPPTNVISLPTLPPRWVRRPLDPQTLQDMEPISEELLNVNERIDDLADDLDARPLRELMERDQRMRQKKRMKTAEKYPYAIEQGNPG
jgi:ssRNA-specific RNase YbeY (16S rRNA maturation enzyme)